MKHLFMVGGGKYRALAVCFLAAAVVLSACNTPVDEDKSPEAKEQVAKPTASPDGGAHPAKGREVYLTTTTAGGIIYYTLDGSEPDSTKTLYTAKFEIEPPVTIKAVAEKEGMVPSAILTVKYTLEENVDGKLLAEKPVATPTPAAEVEYPPKVPISVTLETSSVGADIYYTINGDDPTINSTKYEGAFEVTPTATVKAIAAGENFIDSNMLVVFYKAEGDTTTSPTEPTLPTGEGMKLEDAFVDLRMFIRGAANTSAPGFELLKYSKSSNANGGGVFSANFASGGWIDNGDPVRISYRAATPYLDDKGGSEAIAQIATFDISNFTKGTMEYPLPAELMRSKGWYWANSNEDGSKGDIDWKPISINSKDGGKSVEHHPNGVPVDRGLIYKKVSITDTHYIADITAYSTHQNDGAKDPDRGKPKLPDGWEFVCNFGTDKPQDFNEGKDGDFIYVAVLKKPIGNRGRHQ